MWSPRRWSENDVQEWLAKEGLAVHRRSFHQNAIDGPTLLALGPDELRDELGISDPQDRRVLWKAIAALQNKHHNDQARRRLSGSNDTQYATWAELPHRQGFSERTPSSLEGELRYTPGDGRFSGQTASSLEPRAGIRNGDVRPTLDFLNEFAAPSRVAAESAAHTIAEIKREAQELRRALNVPDGARRVSANSQRRDSSFSESERLPPIGSSNGLVMPLIQRPATAPYSAVSVYEGAGHPLREINCESDSAPTFPRTAFDVSPREVTPTRKRQSEILTQLQQSQEPTTPPSASTSSAPTPKNFIPSELSTEVLPQNGGASGVHRTIDTEDWRKSENRIRDMQASVDRNLRQLEEKYAQRVHRQHPASKEGLSSGSTYSRNLHGHEHHTVTQSICRYISGLERDRRITNSDGIFSGLLSSIQCDETLGRTAIEDSQGQERQTLHTAIALEIRWRETKERDEQRSRQKAQAMRDIATQPPGSHVQPTSSQSHSLGKLAGTQGADRSREPRRIQNSVRHKTEPTAHEGEKPGLAVSSAAVVQQPSASEFGFHDFYGSALSPHQPECHSTSTESVASRVVVREHFRARQSLENEEEDGRAEVELIQRRFRKSIWEAESVEHELLLQRQASTRSISPSALLVSQPTRSLYEADLERSSFGPSKLDDPSSRISQLTALAASSDDDDSNGGAEFRGADGPANERVRSMPNALVDSPDIAARAKTAAVLLTAAHAAEIAARDERLRAEQLQAALMKEEELLQKRLELSVATSQPDPAAAFNAGPSAPDTDLALKSVTMRVATPGGHGQRAIIVASSCESVEDLEEDDDGYGADAVSIAVHHTPLRSVYKPAGSHRRPKKSVVWQLTPEQELAARESESDAPFRARFLQERKREERRKKELMDEAMAEYYRLKRNRFVS
eukprot:NODE_153_length_2999_cov_24.787119_g141_i0.p1 GENE.NODE_153_length_2999_cov_24.787119_g141_i0~~NODE_153_length_2999_cov_24.787119_g141_i0.p1  ORF type:complete len:911 (-),score=173.18 NODE_153_length_2999_cov_24.787119_g141_i0:145-2877(-)